MFLAKIKQQGKNHGRKPQYTEDGLRLLVQAKDYQHDAESDTLQWLKAKQTGQQVQIYGYLGL